MCLAPGLSSRGGEGVAIVLSGPAIGAWKSGESHWRAWSSRLVTATLKVGSGRSDHLHVLCCYALTYAASREEKNEFFDTLQHALSEIPSYERAEQCAGEAEEW